MTISLRPYQETGVDDIRGAYRDGARAVLFSLPTGGGKCLGRDTPILMYDGTIKPVQDVVVGDLLMGPDSKPRTVLSLARGREMLYRVTPVKGDHYVVNESHILSLKRTNTSSNPKYPSQDRGGEIVNISVRDYLGKSNTWKHIHKGWRAAVDFGIKPKLEIPPYILGAWLGDGTTGYASFTTAENEIASEIKRYAKSVGMKLAVQQNSEWSVFIRLVSAGRAYGRGGSPFCNALRSLGILTEKRIPHLYKTASRKQRLDLLAGIIDTDGYYSGKCFDITLKSEKLLDDVMFVARSLGFACYKAEKQKTCHNNGKVGTYYSCNISGDIDQIPCRLHRKQAKPRLQKKNVLVAGIKVDPIGDGDYYGFEIDGDHLFMLGDFTVTHNTFAFSYIAQSAASRGNDVLIVVHRKELLRQASCSLAALGVRHGIVAPANKISPIISAHLERVGQSFIDAHATVHVASVQTLVKRLDKWADRFKLVILDEAHHAVSGSFQAVVDAMPSAKILGVTATPCRLDGKGLGDVFDVLVEGPTIRELIDCGHLVQPKVYAPPTNIDLSGVHRRGGDYVASELAEVMDRPVITGDAVAHYKRLCAGMPGIAFCASVKHAEHVAEEFRRAGISAACVHGGMDDGERDRLILGHGKIVQVLTSCDLISEGTDTVAAQAALLLRPTESESMYLQQVGRILRPMPGKTHAIVLDHVGNTLKHGLPDADREWTLEGRKKRGKGAANDNDPALAVRQCEQCYAAFAASFKACPVCGHVLPVKERKLDQVDGELVEISAAKAAAERARIERRREIGRRVAECTTLDELQALAGELGYASGWAWHRWNILKQRRGTAA